MARFQVDLGRYNSRVGLLGYSWSNREVDFPTSVTSSNEQLMEVRFRSNRLFVLDQSSKLPRFIRRFSQSGEIVFIAPSGEFRVPVSAFSDTGQFNISGVSLHDWRIFLLNFHTLADRDQVLKVAFVVNATFLSTNLYSLSQNTFQASLTNQVLPTTPLTVTLTNELNTIMAMITEKTRIATIHNNRILGKNMFRASPQVPIELRIYPAFIAPRRLGESTTETNVYQSFNVNAIVTPITESSPTENRAGDSGETQQVQESGGDRVLAAQNFIVNAEDISTPSLQLLDTLIKINYQDAIWHVDSVKMFPSIYQFTATTER